MKKTRFSEEQMVKILREADHAPVTEVAKKHGVSEVTIYAWRKRYGQLEAVDVKRLRQLELENGRLKKLMAERDLDIEILKEVAAKNGERACSPSADHRDGEESSVCTNLAITLLRLHCCLEQRQGQSKTPFLVFANSCGHVLQVLDHTDNRVERANLTRFQQVQQQLFSRPVDCLSLLPR